MTSSRWTFGRRALIGMIAAGAAKPGTVFAQVGAAYPTKPVKIIVPYTLGAPTTCWRGCLRRSLARPGRSRG